MITFTLDDAQEARIKEWQRTHECRFRDPRTGQRCGGTFGDIETYYFVPTSVGIVEGVKCACGSSIDVSYPL